MWKQVKLYIFIFLYIYVFLFMFFFLLEEEKIYKNNIQRKCNTQEKHEGWTQCCSKDKDCPPVSCRQHSTDLPTEHMRFAAEARGKHRGIPLIRLKLKLQMFGKEPANAMASWHLRCDTGWRADQSPALPALALAQSTRVAAWFPHHFPSCSHSMLPWAGFHSSSHRYLILE